MWRIEGKDKDRDNRKGEGTGQDTSIIKRGAGQTNHQRGRGQNKLIIKGGEDRTN